MTSYEHDGAGHEPLLEDILASEDARAALSRSRVARCAACAELVALRERLDALGDGERGEVAAARAQPGVPGRAEAAARAQILASLGVSVDASADPSADPSSGASAAPISRPRRAWLSLAAGLAAGLFLWLALRAATRGGDEPDPILGPALELLAPVGVVEDFAQFRWSAGGPEAGWYRVVVEPLDAPGARTDSGRVSGTSWAPSPEVSRAWGTKIRWTLEVYRASDSRDLVDARSATAELSSR